MGSNATASHRYALSFTTGGLLEREASVLAPLYLDRRSWVEVRDVAVADNVLQMRTRSSGVRRVRETVKRLSALSDDEVALLVDALDSERAHLMWAAACRRYDLIGEFAEEVLRERFLTLAGLVSYDDYDAFYRGKSVWHDELDDVTELSYKKLRQVLFRMMMEAGLLDAQGMIEPTLLSARIVELLAMRTPSELRFFPTRAT